MEKYYAQVSNLDLGLRDLKIKTAENRQMIDILTSNLIVPIQSEGISLLQMGSLSSSQLPGIIFSQEVSSLSSLTTSLKSSPLKQN
jgi:hypothetical protein